MAKYQACEFIRTKTANAKKDVFLKAVKARRVVPTKKDGWEKGIAKVSCFGLYDVEFIIDESGKKLSHKEIHNYELRSGLAYAAIDTDHNP